MARRDLQSIPPLKHRVLALALTLASGGCAQRNTAAYYFIDARTCRPVVGDFGPSGSDSERTLSLAHWKVPDAVVVTWEGRAPLEWPAGAKGYEWQVIRLSTGEHTVLLEPTEEEGR